MGHSSVFYDEIKEELKTGDIILFHGVLLSSELNEVLTGGQWSHVGMVIRPEDIGINDSEGLLLWESNTLVNLQDVELNKSKMGPMLINLRQRLITDVKDKKDSKFQLRYNQCQISEKMIEKLKLFIKEVHSDTFVKTSLDMKIEFLEGRIFNKKINNNDYFCSELIADTYIHMGLLTTKYPANSYEPKDFSSEGILPFIKRGTLIDGVFIDVS